MPIDSSAARADRCPNCNAFLPATKDRATHKRCTYCGVEIDLPRALSGLHIPPTTAPTQSWSPSLLTFMMAPVAVAGVIYLWSHSRRGPDEVSTPRAVPAPRVEPPQAVPPVTAPTVAPTPVVPAAGPLLKSKKSRLRFEDLPTLKHNEPCHISGMEMSAVIEANKARARRCFDSDVARFPENVGLTSAWEVEVDGAGQVHAAHGWLRLVDYKRSAELRAANKVELPDAAALACAQSAIRAWQFPAYSAKDGTRMRMKCSMNFTIKELR